MERINITSTTIGGRTSTFTFNTERAARQYLHSLAQYIDFDGAIRARADKSELARLDEEMESYRDDGPTRDMLVEKYTRTIEDYAALVFFEQRHDIARVTLAPEQWAWVDRMVDEIAKGDLVGRDVCKLACSLVGTCAVATNGFGLTVTKEMANEVIRGS